MNSTTLINDGILRGHTSIETAYKVDDYPYGFRLRTSIFYWIETKKDLGDRFCTYTINPKTGRPNKPKCGTYSTFKYLYLDEKGHVQCEGIDSYKTDEFKMKFYRITDKIGEEFLSKEQKDNIRLNHFLHVRGNAPYQLVKYSEEKQQEFRDWYKATALHIQKCEFKDLVEYPDAPEQDNPTGEVKMIVKEYEPKKEEPPTHTITEEKVKGILQKVLPGFHIEVSQYTIFGTYFKIAMAVKEKIQMVSLSLNIKTLELQQQGYSGQGGGSIYRKIDPNNPQERHYAMQRIKIPFRRPACNEKDVLSAIERFASNYKAALIQNKEVLMYQDQVNYNELLTA